MESTTPKMPNLSSLAKSVTKILRFRKLKPSKTTNEDEKQTDVIDREAVESLLANVFASVSAIKASYAQIQVAQSPYDPDTIQCCDQDVISELKHLSQLKQSYFKNQLPLPQPMAAQVQEYRNLLKTYKITVTKIESDIKTKDSEIASLKSQLKELNCSLNGHIHFLDAVKQAVGLVESFAKLMMQEMKTAGWDINAAAVSIQPDVHRRHNDHVFAFVSFVSQIMFSQFNELKSGSTFGSFCREKYLDVVHPEMEKAFFGNLDLRKGISSGKGFPETEFFLSFAEMARRVWLLQCMFSSSEIDASMFQVRRGSRFSEVYMDCVEARVGPMVGFTVVPGFRVGKTVVKCKVYVGE